MRTHDEEIKRKSRHAVAITFGPDTVGEIETCDSIAALESLANLALHRVRELSIAKYAKGVKHD